MEEKGIGRPSTYAPTISTITGREYVAKEGKYLKPTSLGEVINQLMEERFPDIVDLKFTARMEDRLDEIENGKIPWRDVLSDFYGGFDKELASAETALEGVHLKVPDEVTDEICEKCGRHLVVKSGRFGRFLACPGFPECNFTKPIVIEMPGECPKCGSRILKRTSKKGYAYYACEKGAECGFMTWDVPVKDRCPSYQLSLIVPHPAPRFSAALFFYPYFFSQSICFFDRNRALLYYYPAGALQRIHRGGQGHVSGVGVLHPGADHVLPHGAVDHVPVDPAAADRGHDLSVRHHGPVLGRPSSGKEAEGQ